MKNREKYKNELIEVIKKEGKICEFVKSTRYSGCSERTGKVSAKWIALLVARHYRFGLTKNTRHPKLIGAMLQLICKFGEEKP